MKSLILPLFFIIITFTGQPAAHAYRLEGTVLTGSSSVAQATVKAFDATSLTLQATDTTNTSGHYQMNLGSGSYYLQVTPTTASGLAKAVVTNISIGTANVVQDIQLVAKPVTTTITGYVKNADGSPAADVEFYLRPVQGQVMPSSGGTRTDITGKYTLTVRDEVIPAGIQYDAEAMMHIWGTTKTPSTYWRINPLATRVTVASNFTLPDQTLPISRLFGKITDQNVTPLPNVCVCTKSATWSANGSTFEQGELGFNENCGCSDTNGDYSLYTLPKTDHTINAFPNRQGLMVTSKTEILSITADTEHNISMLPMPTVITGYARDAAGQPLRNVLVYLTPLQTQKGNMGYTDNTGKYAIGIDEVVTPGVQYKLGLNSLAENVSPFAPNSNWMVNPLTDGLTLQNDYSLAEVRPTFPKLSGKISDQYGKPVAGLKVCVRSYNNSSASGVMYLLGEGGFYLNCATTNTSGDYFLYTIPRPDHQIGVISPAGSGFTDLYTPLSIMSDTNYNATVQAPPSTTITGRITDVSGNPAPNVEVSLTTQQGQVSATGTTDASGSYAITIRQIIPAGTQFTVDVANHSGGVIGAPIQYWRIHPLVTGAVLSVGNALPDVSLPAFPRLSGTVTDNNGVPIANNSACLDGGTWSINGTSYDLDEVGFYAICGTSDQDGNFSVIALPNNDYRLRVVPPSGSNIAQQELTNIDLLQDRFMPITVTIPDTRPPSIIAGPIAATTGSTTALIEWLTNEPTTSTVVYGTALPPSGSHTVTTSSAKHAVVLAGLAPDTLYNLYVTAVDAAGHGPVSSSTITFRTATTDASLPPLFTHGPTVTAVTSDAATVSWTTDQPTTGQIDYGTTADFGQTAADTVPMHSHETRITGLQAGNRYKLRIAATGLAGSGTGNSRVVEFSTLPTPDRYAPVITGGPLVTEVTDTAATLIWQTDKPATTAASWHNGTTFDLVRETTVTTEHVVRLTGLTPATSYSVVAAATDTAGNGPTLSGSRAFTTLTSTDFRAPVCTDGPVAQGITDQAATIHWVTDIPGDSIVDYGPTAALGLLAGGADHTRHHDLLLTGLQPGTDYFYRVTSRDGSGDGPTAGAVYRFSTAAQPVQATPAITTPPHILASGDRTLTLAWETDLPTDALAEYGGADGILQRRNDDRYSRMHRLALTGLQPAAGYAVTISSTALNGKTISSREPAFPLPALPSDFITSTFPDQLPPLIVNGPTVAAISDQSAVLYWQTSEATDAQALYNLAGEPLVRVAADLDSVTEHYQVLANLQPVTAYEAQVFGTDPAGNRSAGSTILRFTTTAAPDTLAPAFISLPAVPAVSDTAARIAWGTDKPATAVIAYGPAADTLTQSISLTGLATGTEMLLTGLTPDTAYYYAVTVTDSSANVTRSPTAQLRTTALSRDILPPAGSLVIAGGSAGTTTASVNLSLQCSDANACTTVALSNDGSTWTTTGMATTIGWDLSPGSGRKTVSARFSDAQGNWSRPATASIMLDPDYLTVTSAVPASRAMVSQLTAPITLTFNQAIAPATLNNGTFSLTRAGIAVPGSIAYNSDTKTATFTPGAPLAPHALYQIELTTAVSTPAGAPLSVPFSSTFTTGATPDTTITSAPAPQSGSTTTTFAFTSDTPGATFECSNDGIPFAVCSSPLSLFGLASGTHTFRTRARDGFGNYDPTPAQAVWTVGANIKLAIDGLSDRYFDAFTDAWSQMPASAAKKILLQNREYPETVIIGRCDEEVTISGGYDATFTAKAGASTIAGTMTILCGTAVVEDLMFR
jgi:hypothetical protein